MCKIALKWTGKYKKKLRTVTDLGKEGKRSRLGLMVKKATVMFKCY